MPNQTVTEFLIPPSNNSPFSITLGPDGNVWFTEIGIKRLFAHENGCGARLAPGLPGPRNSVMAPPRVMRPMPLPLPVRKGLKPRG